MKLSQLKALVAHIETAVLETNPDPDVQFWAIREGIENIGPKDSPHFVQFTLDSSITSVGATMHRTSVAPDNHGVLSQNGDFHLPVLIAPFYV